MMVDQSRSSRQTRAFRLALPSLSETPVAGADAIYEQVWGHETDAPRRHLSQQNIASSPVSRLHTGRQLVTSLGNQFSNPKGKDIKTSPLTPPHPSITLYPIPSAPEVNLHLHPFNPTLHSTSSLLISPHPPPLPHILNTETSLTPIRPSKSNHALFNNALCRLRGCDLRCRHGWSSSAHRLRVQTVSHPSSLSTLNEV